MFFFLFLLKTNGLKEMTPPQILSSRNDSTRTNIKSSSNQPPSAHLSQSNKHRQRAVSMLSSASAISDVLNQNTLLEDDNCSLKSDDLMCDYDDTLTIDSTSKKWVLITIFFFFPCICFTLLFDSIVLLFAVC